MVYLLNNNLKNNKTVTIAMKDIFGLGGNLSQQICDQLGISSRIKIKQLTNYQLELMTQVITQNYSTGLELNRLIQTNKKRLVFIASYRGFRHSQGLPVRGQRTHGNARTSRKFKKSS